MPLPPDNTPFAEPATRYRYAVVGWLTTAAVLAYLCRNCVGVAESSINTELGLSRIQSGWFLGAFFWSYALLQVPGGLIGRRWGTRRVLSLGAVAWSFAIALLASASFLNSSRAAFVVLLGAQLLMGAAQASAFPCAVQSLRLWVSARGRAFASSCLSSGMQVGAVLAASLTAFLLQFWSWEAIFFLYAVPGLVWAVGFALWFRNRPEDHPQVNAAELAIIHEDNLEDERRESRVPSQKVADDQKPPVQDSGPALDSGPSTLDEQATWQHILANRSVWFLCGQQMCRASGYAFFATWFPSFLQATRNVSTTNSGYLQSLVFAGTLIGGLVSGRVLDTIYARTGNLRLSRVAVGVTSMVICSGLILASYLVYEPRTAVALIAAGAFAASFAGPCAYVATIDIGGDNVPQVFGLMNMAGNLAAAATPVLVAAFFERVADWNLVLCLFAGIYLAAAVCWGLIDPSNGVGRS